MLYLKFVNRTCGTIANRAHPSVVRRNRLLELNLWSTRGGAVYLAIVMVDGDIIVDVTILFHSLNSLTLLAR